MLPLAQVEDADGDQQGADQGGNCPAGPFERDGAKNEGAKNGEPERGVSGSKPGHAHFLGSANQPARIAARDHGKMNARTNLAM
jgi:hypothetical protein